MIKVKLNDIKGLRDALVAINNLIEEGIFKFEADGVSLKAMDPSQISMVKFLAKKSDFSEYNVPEPVSIGVKISDLTKIISNAAQENVQSVTLKTKDNTLEVVIEESGKALNFKLPLLDISQTLTGEPKIVDAAVVRMLGGALKRTLKNCELAGSYVTFICSKSSFIVESKGDISSFSAEFDKTSNQIGEISTKSDTPVKATYPLQYINDIVKGASDTASMTITYSQSGVLKMSYNIPLGEIYFYLAPIREEF